MIGVERWAEIRRMPSGEGRSIREISRRMGLHRETIRGALAADAPPRYERAPVPSKLDPFKPWIEEQLRADPEIPAKRLRELAEQLGYCVFSSAAQATSSHRQPSPSLARTYQPHHQPALL